MNAIERRQYDMLLRVRDFGDSHGHLFPSSSVARQNFEDVAAAAGSSTHKSSCTWRRRTRHAQSGKPRRAGRCWPGFRR